MSKFTIFIASMLVLCSLHVNAAELQLGTPKNTSVRATAGDLVEFRIPFTSAQKSMLSDLKVTIEGDSLKKVVIASVANRGEAGQAIMGTGNYSLFAMAEKAGKAKVVITPIGVDGDEKKKVEFEVTIDKAE